MPFKIQATGLKENQHIIELLHKGGCSCVVAKDEEIRTFKKRGVIDLYEIIEGNPQPLNASSVADKIVGKAAAALMLLGGVTHIYADVISEPAIALLKGSKVELQFGKSVPFIKNRDKSGIFPLENRCSSTDSLPELITLIKEFVDRIRHC